MPATERGISGLPEFTVPGYDGVYVIGGRGGSPVTVYSQQVRALRLVWGLCSDRKLERGDTVVVIGGGIAGVTAGAAAALVGAKVTIVEQGEELLHLQRGCHTRYLHPRISEWPARNARRATAGLPFLTWSVGTASEVADVILSDYHRIRLQLNASSVGSLRDVTDAREIRLDASLRSVSWTMRPEVRSRPGQTEKEEFDQAIVAARTVILALGFGLEETVERLPRRSYWRVNSLTQTGIDSDDEFYTVLVSGTGDGGLIDVLRAKLKNFDHGGFFDECALRLEHKDIAEAITKSEQEARAQERAMWAGMENRLEIDPKEGDSRRRSLDSELSSFLHWRYCQLETAGQFKEVDRLLNYTRPRTNLVWLGRTPFPLSYRSQPLNRLLAWRLWRLGHATYIQGELGSVDLLDQEGAAGHRYRGY